MSGFVSLFIMSILLGVGAFGLGMIPLSISLSKIHTSQLQILGAGLLLGTALGVIIPEGIETLSRSRQSSDVPTHKISLSLLVGFAFMFLVEQFSSHEGHSHSPSTIPLSIVQPSTNVENSRDSHHSTPEFLRAGAEIRADMRAYPFTLGLLIHALADGLALGVSVLSSESGVSPDISLVVFIALFVHKAPTALALTTSLLSTTLSRTDCRKHLLAFSASTPLGALVSYALFSFLGVGDENEDWTGIALLISGGTFLYVATVLQPMPQMETRPTLHAIFLIVGMFLPFLVGSVIGHGHDHHPDGHSLRRS